jgi:hypothetical protein
MNKYAKRILFRFHLEAESHEPLTQNIRAAFDG